MNRFTQDHIISGLRFGLHDLWKTLCQRKWNKLCLSCSIEEALYVKTIYYGQNTPGNVLL